MPLLGVLRTWNDDRAFGFIAPTHGGAELFVHISAFPRDGTRPTVGERLQYELGRGKDGRPQAVKVVRSAVGDKPRTSKPPAKRQSRSTRWVGSLLVVVLFVGAGVYAYNRYQSHERRLSLQHTPAEPTTNPVQEDLRADYRCDGRTTCGQMTSCTEAKWFINNCPGTQMDGNGDGVPCERQWCSSPLSN